MTVSFRSSIINTRLHQALKTERTDAFPLHSGHTHTPRERENTEVELFKSSRLLRRPELTVNIRIFSLQTRRAAFSINGKIIRSFLFWRGGDARSREKRENGSVECFKSVILFFFLFL